MSSAQHLNLRLFLEGVEVSVIGATVVQAVGSPATAQIQVLPDPSVLRLAPRTMVHLFVKEPGSAGGDVDAQYVLLFSGDLTSVQYSKTSSNRNATLICQDDSSYLDLGYMYFQSEADIAGDDIQGLTRERALFIGAQTGFTAVTPSGALSQLLETVFTDATPASRGFSDARGLLGAVLKIIEMFTGIDDIRKAGANQFFTFHAHRKQLLAQIGALSEDTTAERILGGQFIVDFIRQKADQLGQLITVRQLVSYILDFIYYKLVPISSPYYTSKEFESIDTFDERVLERLMLIDELRRGDLRVYPPAGERADEIVARLIEIDYGADQVLRAASSQAIRSGERTGESVYRVASELADTLRQQLIIKTDTELKKSARLWTTVILPDLYFAVPPTCNVLYPDLYTTFSYTRDITAEPTRMHLTTNIDASLMGGSNVDQLVYYAPSISAISGVQSQSAATQADTVSEAARRVGGYLFDHELNTGVTPAFSRVDRLAYMIALQASEASGATGDEQMTPAERDEFFLRIVNGQFVRKRLEKRRANASGILNPYAVPGMPMVVIDGYPTPGGGDVFTDEATDKNEHYVGLLQSVSHSVSQQGAGSTSYELAYVRPHRSKDDEFLQSLTLAQSGASVPLEEAIRPRYIDDIYAAPGITKVYERIIGVKSVVDVHAKAAKQAGKTLVTYTLTPGNARAPVSKSAHRLEDIIDVMAAGYGRRARRSGTDASFRAVRRRIASLPQVLGQGGFHHNAWAQRNADKPLSLMPEVLYDNVKQAGPPGYRPATPQEVQDAKSRINPALDVRADRHKRVLDYAASQKDRGKLG